MSERLTDSIKYVGRYQRLIDEVEQTAALLGQLDTGNNSDMSLYLDNLQHLGIQIQTMLAIYNSGEAFKAWLQREDIDLWCSITATELTCRMMENHLVNLQNLFSQDHRGEYKTDITDDNAH